MSTLTVIHHLPHDQVPTAQAICLRADRTTLGKRRWRGAAEDGREFGFDLHEPLAHGKIFLLENGISYVVAQKPETVLEIPFHGAEQAARIAWSLGNLHFGVQVTSEALRVVDDPAVRQLLAREKLDHRHVDCIFLLLSAGASHHHEHAHDHAH